MRWDHLFADLEAQFAELADAEMMAELADRQRVAGGAVLMIRRLAGSVGLAVRVRTLPGIVVAAVLRAVGPDWLLLEEGPGRDVVVAIRAVTMVEGLTLTTAPDPGSIALRMDLRRVLRGIARDRSPVALVLPGGGSEGGRSSVEITGTIDRLGADFLEMALHAPWEPRRAASVRSVVLVPLDAIVLVRALPLG